MSFDNELAKVLGVLREYQDIFESDLSHPSLDKGRVITDPDGDSYRSISLPSGASRDNTDGLKLREGMGIVTIQINYLMVNSREVEEVGHTYRYIDSSHTVSMVHSVNDIETTWGPEPFSFRYDKDLTPRAQNDPPIHLQLAHGVPRFVMKDVTLGDFLRTVKETCFSTSFEANKEPFFANRR